MATRKNILIAILATFCLTSLLFVIPILSQQQQWGYNPWSDINDDGRIDMSDIYDVCKRFGAVGAPVNKTELLINVNNTFTQLLARINSLNSTIIELQNTVNYLNNTIVYLNETLVFLNSTGLGKPDYDSGWVGPAGTFYHNLNTTNVFVYLVGKDENGFIHNWGYGFYYDGWNNRGGTWHKLDLNSITIYIGNAESEWVKSRIMIWKISV